MEDPRIQEAVRKFTEAYGSVVFAARDLDPAGLREGVMAVLAMSALERVRADQLQARLDAVERVFAERTRNISLDPSRPDRARTELDVACDYCGAVVGRGCDWGPEPHDAVFHMTRAAKFLEEEKGK